MVLMLRMIPIMKLIKRMKMKISLRKKMRLKVVIEISNS